MPRLGHKTGTPSLRRQQKQFPANFISGLCHRSRRLSCWRFFPDEKFVSSTIPGMFPVEGAVLDLWKLHKSRLPSRHSKGARCNKNFEGCWLGSRHQCGVAHRGPVSIGAPRGLDVTVADVFKSAAPRTGSATVTVVSDGGMVPSQAEMLAFKSSQSEPVRLLNARTGSKINCMPKAFGDYAQQARPAWLQAVTRVGATVEVLCHADL